MSTFNKNHHWGIRGALAAVLAILAAIGPYTAPAAWAEKVYETAPLPASAAAHTTPAHLDSEAERKRIYLLGIDPAIGYVHRPKESETARRIEIQRGVTLRRASRNNPADWTDIAGNTYDAVGNFPAKYFNNQWPNLKHQIHRHLNKAHYVPVDVSQFTKEQKMQVREYVRSQPQFASRVFLVGDEENESA